MPKSSGQRLKEQLAKGQVVAAGAFVPFVARLVEDAGYDAIYVSGAALSNSLARPDEGLLPRRKVLEFTREIVEVVDLPVIVDVDTGFGGPVGTAETVRLFEAAGAAAVQIEDQDPRWKRCGHLEGKHLISCERMAEKVRAAVDAKRDPGFQIIARTDAVAVEGYEPAVERARAYEAAGADVIFPEALTSREMFADFRSRVKVPLLANMTEFGKSPWLSDADFAEIGYALVLHPVTTFRFAARQIKEALVEMKRHGNQETLVRDGKLMPRGEIDTYLKPNP
ncbi:MAG TPA: isocitrate lyase/phosphoenolpyruvate mutase family protein [Dehalococcoidia bacterium]|jgi:methylisocitrate lyase|nr:isocitrate lyase/phosphoenolpyruvate mutase family protein [Dehalococcoidia bacterium]